MNGKRGKKCLPVDQYHKCEWLGIACHSVPGVGVPLSKALNLKLLQGSSSSCIWVWVYWAAVYMWNRALLKEHWCYANQIKLNLIRHANTHTLQTKGEPDIKRQTLPVKTWHYIKPLWRPIISVLCCVHFVCHLIFGQIKHAFDIKIYIAHIVYSVLYTGVLPKVFPCLSPSSYWERL